MGTAEKYCLVKELTLSQTSSGFHVSEVQVFWKHCWKVEIACKEQFLLGLFAMFDKYEIYVCKIFQVGRV